MELAQRASSMILALRRKVNIKVRQPLAKILIPVLDNSLKDQFELVKNLVLGEVNVKEVEYIHETVSEDMPGWLVAVDGRLTIALDITVNDELSREGIAREIVNRIQNLRKE